MRIVAVFLLGVVGMAVAGCVPVKPPPPVDAEVANCEAAWSQIVELRPDAVTAGHLCHDVSPNWCFYRPPTDNRAECNADGPEADGSIDSVANFYAGFAHELGHAWWTNRLTDAQRVRFAEIFPPFPVDYGVQERHAEVFAGIVYGKTSDWVTRTSAQTAAVCAEGIVPCE